MKLDKKDVELLKELQSDCKQSLKKMSRKLNTSITTIYDRIKKLEKNNVIKGYKAILDNEKVGKTVTAFVFVKMRYHYPDDPEPLSQKEVAKKISFIPGVQEVHITSGNWDIIIKAKAENNKAIGEFVIDKIRKIKGVDATMTSDVWMTFKETCEIDMN